MVIRMALIELCASTPGPDFRLEVRLWASSATKISQTIACVSTRSIFYVLIEPFHHCVIILTAESVRVNQEGLQQSLKHEEETLLRRKRGINDPTLWPNYTIPFVFTEPFRK